MKILLSVLVGAAVVCMAHAINLRVSPLFVSPSLEVLTKEEMVDELKGRDGLVMRPRKTAAILYNVKDKENTEVIPGVTVADLLALNYISAVDCTKAEFDRRRSICSDNTFFVSIKPYCQQCLELAASFCRKSLNEGIRYAQETEEYIRNVALNR